MNSIYETQYLYYKLNIIVTSLYTSEENIFMKVKKIAFRSERTNKNILNYLLNCKYCSCMNIL